MSTTRHRRRSWQQIGIETTIGILIGADALWTLHAHNGLERVSTLALGVFSAALILGAFAWLCSTAWHNGRHRYLVHAAAYTPLRRPLHPINTEGQDNPPAAAALHDATTADHWRHDEPLKLDEITGSRPYLPPTAHRAT